MNYIATISLVNGNPTYSAGQFTFYDGLPVSIDLDSTTDIDSLVKLYRALQRDVLTCSSIAYVKTVIYDKIWFLTHELTNPHSEISMDVYDGLDSTDSNIALSANMGYELDQYKAPLDSPVFEGYPLTTKPDYIIENTGYYGFSWPAEDTQIVPVEMLREVTEVIENREYSTLQHIKCDVVPDGALLTNGINVYRFNMPYDFLLSSIKISVGTAMTGTDEIQIEVKADGYSITGLGSISLIDAEKFKSDTYVDGSTLSENSEITIDIVDNGDNTATGLKVYLIGRHLTWNILQD